MQEQNLSRSRRFRKHLKVPVRDSEEIGQAQILSSSKQTYCAPAEWNCNMSLKSSMQPDPRKMADEHNNALNTQVISEIKRRTVKSSPQVNMGHTGHGKEARQSYMFNALPIEGMDNSVGQQTIIPGYIDQCM